MAYCTTADVESILSAHGLTAVVDDNLTYARDGSETTYISNAIAMAATLHIDIWLNQRYTLSDLTSNEYCRWANAIFAAFALAQRRNQSAPDSLTDEREILFQQLQSIHRGYNSLPGQAEPVDRLPSVTNFIVERYRGVMPVRVRQLESTRAQPVNGVLRKKSRFVDWIDIE